jgi:anti-anti-sigma regulatory factor
MAKRPLELLMNVTTVGDAQHVKFSGSLNEDARRQLAELAKTLPKSCVFDLGDVEHINSCGVREWIIFLRNASSGRTIRFENCPPVMVEQFSMVPNMIENAIVGSVVGRTACADCNHTVNQAYKLGPNDEPPPPNVFSLGVCGRCGGQLELIEDDVYMTFLETWIQPRGRPAKAG